MIISPRILDYFCRKVILEINVLILGMPLLLGNHYFKAFSVGLVWKMCVLLTRTDTHICSKFLPIHIYSELKLIDTDVANCNSSLLFILYYLLPVSPIVEHLDSAIHSFDWVFQDSSSTVHVLYSHGKQLKGLCTVCFAFLVYCK